MTRRCTQRQHLLRPDPRVEQIYLYCLGEAVQRFQIALHAYVAMSNHQHILVRDNLGNFPAFLAHFHKMVAKALNAFWGRWENLWSTEQPSAVYLVDAQDRFDKLIYVLTNPVNADLVERVADWPGACSFSQQLGLRPRVVKRPRGFFREDGKMPEEVTLQIERIDGFEHLSEREWRDKVSTAVESIESSAKKARAREGRRVLGRKGVLGIEPTSAPRTIAPRRRLRPLIACKNLLRRVEELLAIKTFRVAYRTALARWIAGERQVFFPDGTYRMRAFGVRTRLTEA